MCRQPENLKNAVAYVLHDKTLKRTAEPAIGLFERERFYVG